MAIYHLAVRAIRRSHGQLATAIAAKRSGQTIKDERTLKTYSCNTKATIDYRGILGFEGTRSELWNLAENAERRKDATVAREYEVALPIELNHAQNIALAIAYAHWLHQRHTVAVDVCVHDLNGHNPHAFMLTTTRVVQDNLLGSKASREWSDTRRKQAGLPGRKSDLIEARERWQCEANHALVQANVNVVIDNRTLAAQGIQRQPQINLGCPATQMEKRGLRTKRGDRLRCILRFDSEIQQHIKPLSRQHGHPRRI